MSDSKINRRQVLKTTAQVTGGFAILGGIPTAVANLNKMQASGVFLNDAQSQLNRTRVHRVEKPNRLDELSTAVREARKTGRAISVSGGRHSMGAQQFGTDNLHLDVTGLNRIVDFDKEKGLVTVEAGIQWPELIEGLRKRQVDGTTSWTIREKQTGVDSVTIGGSLSSNIHGRGLLHPPFASDVESFDLVDSKGQVQHCSRNENKELFSLAIGGYGLFGLVAHVTLRLVRRFKVRRKVEVIKVKDLLDKYNARIKQGFVFGDCQYATDLSGTAEEHLGVFPCYETVPDNTPIPETQKALSGEDWAKLYKLIRTDKRKAFEVYSKYYLNTNGQVYWSDTHQLAGNFTKHRAAVDAQKGTEMITEVYLKHYRLMEFFGTVRADLLEQNSDITYGTIRFIEEDKETFLPWAKEKSVCVVCNLHVKHTKEGIAKAKADFRKILDRVIEFDGRFFLTYHRWATPDHIRTCYPNITEFFQLKKKYDPDQLFQSDWYRQYAPHFT